MEKTLKFFYQNTRGLRTKIARGLYNRVTLKDYDIIGLTETWLCDKIDSESIFDSDTYITHRRDRTKETYPRFNEHSTNDLVGGGALIAIKRTISATRQSHWETEVPFDNVWLKLNMKNNTKLFINCIYINHQTNFERINLYFEQLNDIINMREPNAHYIILGDFNIPCVEWIYDNNQCIALHHEGRLASELLSTLTLTDLKQINYIKNDYNRVLDLALTNLTNIKPKRVQGIVNEDAYHPAILLNIESNNIKFMKSKKTAKLNYFKANYELINNAITNMNWTKEFLNLDINEATEKFYHIINI